MSFGARLNAIANLVPVGKKIVDVGTDHAYLPVLLAQKGKISRAIAGDIAEGPCEAAQKTVDFYRLGNVIEVRTGNGLKIVAPGEVEVAVMAGMGGATIIEILTESQRVVDSLERLVLQPMNGAELLRKYLLQHNWYLRTEDLVAENAKLYEIIVAEKGWGEIPKDDIYYEIGPLLLNLQHTLLPEHLQRLISKYTHLLAAMEKSNTAKHSERYQEFLRKKNKLEEIYNENYCS